MLSSFAKDFGVWKEDRRNNKNVRFIYFLSFLFYTGFAVFFLWLMLLVMERIKSDFFYFQASSVQLTKKPAGQKGVQRPFYFSERPVSLKLYAQPLFYTQDVNLSFDSGESFQINGEKKQLKNYLQKRVNEISLTAMLVRKNLPSASRAQIWLAPNITFRQRQMVMDVLRQAGFDDFDFAVEE